MSRLEFLENFLPTFFIGLWFAFSVNELYVSLWVYGLVLLGAVLSFVFLHRYRTRAFPRPKPGTPEWAQLEQQGRDGYLYITALPKVSNGGNSDNTRYEQKYLALMQRRDGMSFNTVYPLEWDVDEAESIVGTRVHALHYSNDSPQVVQYPSATFHPGRAPHNARLTRWWTQDYDDKRLDADTLQGVTISSLRPYLLHPWKGALAWIIRIGAVFLPILALAPLSPH